jgi:branched-chain amino acid transport system ATP-binding protein
VRFRGRAVVSDPATLFDKLTVYENLLVAGTFGRDKSEAEVAHTCAIILERTELISKANTPAGGLSLLERKRLETGPRHGDGPQAALLDEIAGGLTDAECQSLIETIKAVHAEGVTIIWIEHVLHALTRVVERLLVLDFGKVIGIGEPASDHGIR